MTLTANTLDARKNRGNGFGVTAPLAYEKLCRYVARPPVATQPLSRLPDGLLLYHLKHRWRDGTTHVLFEPLELVEKLAALVPPPRFNLVQYHGLLAPAAHWRPLVIPSAPRTEASEHHSRRGCKAESSGRKIPLGEYSKKQHRNRYSTVKHLGGGQFYLMTAKDKDGRALDGAR